MPHAVADSGIWRDKRLPETHHRVQQRPTPGRIVLDFAAAIVPAAVATAGGNLAESPYAVRAAWRNDPARLAGKVVSCISKTRCPAALADPSPFT